MVLIAIDKHSRKILGYLCKNNQTVAYCCSECEVEFTTAIALEEHMVTHEQKSTETIQRISDVDNDDDDKLDEPQCEENNETLTEDERENLLKIKYQVILFDTFVIVLCFGNGCCVLILILTRILFR